MLTPERQYANMPDNFVFIAFYFVLPKRELFWVSILTLSSWSGTVFLNSLLATLNARRALRETNSTALVSIPLSTTQNSHMSFTGRPQFTPSSSVRDDQVCSSVFILLGCCDVNDLYICSRAALQYKSERRQTRRQMSTAMSVPQRRCAFLAFHHTTSNYDTGVITSQNRGLQSIQAQMSLWQLHCSSTHSPLRHWQYMELL